ncbi:MAG: TolC family protein [Bacteroidales bacterium]|nr:TolC family protein [Bacteroidales bacterium]
MKTIFHMFVFLPLFVSMGMTAQTALTLEDCRRMALQNDPYVKNAGLDIYAAQAQKKEVVSEYFPKVSLNSFGFLALNPVLEIGVKDILGENDFSNNVQMLVSEAASAYGFSPVFSTMKSGFSASVSAMQPVFTGGRIVAGNKLAALGVETAQIQRDMMIRETGEKVENGYWQVVSLEEKLRTLEKMGEFVDTLHNDVKVAVDAGLAVDTDLMQVIMKGNELRSGIVRLCGSIRLAKMNLFNSIGQNYSLLPALADSLCPFIDDIVLADRLDTLKPPQHYYVPEEEILVSLEEIRLLEARIRAESLTKRMTLGEALPQIGVGGSYGYTHAINGRLNGAVFATLQIPLSDWGRVSRKMQRQDFVIQKAVNEKDYLSAQLLLQIRQLWLDLNVAWEQLQIAEEGISLAAKTMETVKDRFDAGLIPVVELLQAQVSFMETSESYFNAKVAYSTALTAYCGRK